MKRLPAFVVLLPVFLGATLLSARAISIVWDYTYDSSGFFDTARRDVLDAVASNFANYLINRDALVPSGGNTWSWNFTNPGTGGNEVLADPIAGAGELRVFVGARDLGTGVLGLGGNVGWGASGTGAWINEITATNTPTAYRPFGGTISMNTNASITWFSGLDNAVPSGHFDLYTVLLHELGHVLGIGLYGTVDAWDVHVDTGDDTFVGPVASATFGGPVPLEPDWWHIRSGTEFAGQTLVMVPSLPSGTRREWTAVEFGILQDMGYELIPEPGTMGLLVLAGVVLWWRRRAAGRERGALSLN
jgi:hypothetical protein